MTPTRPLRVAATARRTAGRTTSTTGHVVALAGVAQAGRAGAVAGDDQRLHAGGDQLVHDAPARARGPRRSASARTGRARCRRRSAAPRAAAGRGRRGRRSARRRRSPPCRWGRRCRSWLGRARRSRYGRPAEGACRAPARVQHEGRRPTPAAKPHTCACHETSEFSVGNSPNSSVPKKNSTAIGDQDPLQPAGEDGAGQQVAEPAEDHAAGADDDGVRRADQPGQQAAERPRRRR